MYGGGGKARSVAVQVGVTVPVVLTVDVKTLLEAQKA